VPAPAPWSLPDAAGSQGVLIRRGNPGAQPAACASANRRARRRSSLERVDRAPHLGAGDVGQFAHDQSVREQEDPVGHGGHERLVRDRDASPEVGRSSPARMCSNVDLPDPDGPMTATNSPRARTLPRSSRARSSLWSTMTRRSQRTHSTSSVDVHPSDGGTTETGPHAGSWRAATGSGSATICRSTSGSASISSSGRRRCASLPRCVLRRGRPITR